MMKITFKMVATYSRPLAASAISTPYFVDFPAFKPEGYMRCIGKDDKLSNIFHVTVASLRSGNADINAGLNNVFGALTYSLAGKSDRARKPSDSGLRAPVLIDFIQYFTRCESSFLQPSEIAFLDQLRVDLIAEKPLQLQLVAFHTTSPLSKEKNIELISLRKRIATPRFELLSQMESGESQTFFCMRVPTKKMPVGHIARITFHKQADGMYHLRIYDDSSHPDSTPIRQIFSFALPTERAGIAAFLSWLRKGLTHWSDLQLAADLIDKFDAVDITADHPMPFYQDLRSHYCSVASIDMRIIENVRPEVWQLLLARRVHVFEHFYPTPKASAIDVFFRIRPEMRHKSSLLPAKGGLIQVYALPEGPNEKTRRRCQSKSDEVSAILKKRHPAIRSSLRTWDQPPTALYDDYIDALLAEANKKTDAAARGKRK